MQVLLFLSVILLQTVGIRTRCTYFHSSATTKMCCWEKKRELGACFWPVDELAAAASATCDGVGDESDIAASRHSTARQGERQRRLTEASGSGAGGLRRVAMASASCGGVGEASMVSCGRVGEANKLGRML